MWRRVATPNMAAPRTAIRVAPNMATHLPAKDQAAMMLSARVADCNAAFANLCGASESDELKGTRYVSLVGTTSATLIERALRFVHSGYCVNGVHNDRWTIAMARTNDPNSATAQFFINTKMNSSLDAKGKTPGYAVFGIVTDGQHVVKAIEKAPTMTLGQFGDVPVEAIIIEKVVIQP